MRIVFQNLLKMSLVLIYIMFFCNNAFASTLSWQTSPSPNTVASGSSILVTFSQPVNSSQLPANAVLSSVQVQYNYIAYGGYQNYLTARINKGSDPVTTGGVSLGNPPASATTGSSYTSNPVNNWSGQSAKDTFYVRFITANGCNCNPGPTIKDVTLTLTYTVTYPDLVATRTYLYSISGYEVTSPKIGDQVHINLDWHMDNQSATGPFYVNCYLNGSLFSSSQKTGTWGTGNYYHSTPEIWNITTSGNYDVYCTLDANGNVTESSEGNNTESNSWTVHQQFDLVHGTLDIVDANGNIALGYVDDTVYFRINYNVTGSGTTPAFNIACNLDGSPFKTWTGITGTGGQSYSLTTPGYAVTTAPAGHNISCDLDSTGQISESNESNNNLSNGWTPSQRADLTVAAPAAVGSFMANQAVQIPITVSKTGTDLTSGTYVEAKLYWSTNNSWDASDTPLWTSNNGATPDFPNSTLNSSGSKTVTTTVTIPNVSNGTYYIIAYVDPSNFHSEGAEDNNIAVYTITIETQASSPSLTPLYRLYKASIKDHFYTIDPTERDDAVNNHGFVYERVEGFVSSVSFIGSFPLYRLYLSGNDIHFYTTREDEKNAKVAAGYTLEEDRTCYIYQTQKEWTSPLYFASHADNTDNFYTTSWYEYKNAIDNWGFTGNGIIGYVATKIANNRPQGNFAGVGMASGNFSLPAFTDLALAGVGPQLSFTRYYDSYSPGSTLGQGWSFNYDSFILEDTAGVHVEWGNGSESHFDTSLNALPGYFEKAVKINDGSNYGYDITTKDQTVYQFRRLSPSNIPLMQITDKHNNSLTLDRYAGYGVVIKATDSTARQFIFEYSPFSLSTGNIVQRLTKVTDMSINRFVTMSYYTAGNAQGNLQSVTDARGNTTTYSYNADGYLSAMTYPEGNTVNVTYDALGRATGYTNGSISVTFEYNATTGTTVKNGTSKLVNFLPDDQKRAGKITYADNANDYSQPTYCPGNLLNQPCNVRDRNSNTTTYTYDANGNVLTASNALNETTTFTYDPLGKNNLISVKDPRNNTTSYGYDANYINLLSITKPASGTSAYSGHTASGLVGTITDPNGHDVTYSYDANGNVTKINDNDLGTSMDFTNDDAGRRLTQTDQMRPTPQQTTWVYDNNDNVISAQVGGNAAAQFRYDMNNRLYNVVDQRGKTTVYTYNTANLLATQQSPDGKLWQYNYDSVGNLASVTLPDNNIISYLYYTNNRLNKIRYNSADKIIYTYDLNGNVTSLADAATATATSFIYNAANRVTRIVNPFGSAFDYEYDTAGNRTSITYPGNKVVDYTFDADNRLSTVKDWLGTATTTYTYDKGLLKSMINANGTKVTYGYDAANRLTWLTNQRNNNTVIAAYELTLDKVGNPTSIFRNEPLAPSVPTATDVAYGYNNANQIQNAGSVTYAHDALGNLSAVSNGKSFTFDYANRLTGATVGADAFGFVYDAFGNRISRTKNTTETTRYLLDLNAGMSNVLAETNAAGVVQNYYIYGQGLISRIDNSGNRFTYHYDQLGNTVVVTDGSQNITEKYTYDEFGTLLASDSATSNPFRFVGQFGVMDEGNGLLYMRARYYDTTTGRFLSRDPLGFDGGDLNLYAYVGENPIAGIDPEGLVGTQTANSTQMMLPKNHKQDMYIEMAKNSAKQTVYFACYLTTYGNFCGDQVDSDVKLGVALGKDAANIFLSFFAPGLSTVTRYYDAAGKGLKYGTNNANKNDINKDAVSLMSNASKVPFGNAMMWYYDKHISNK